MDDAFWEREDGKDDRKVEQWSLNGVRDALFSVFLLHLLPLISSGDKLEMDGFVKLES